MAQEYNTPVTVQRIRCHSFLRSGPEEFGDLLISAIDFDNHGAPARPEGYRVKIAMSGKFLGYKSY